MDYLKFEEEKNEIKWQGQQHQISYEKKNWTDWFKYWCGKTKFRRKKLSIMKAFHRDSIFRPQVALKVI